MREHFDHTADLGLRAQAATLDELFSEMALCLAEAIIEDLSTIGETESRSITISGTDLEYLLFDWLRALLQEFERDRFLPCRCVVVHHAEGLAATIYGEPVLGVRHLLSHEVKAITYHGLKLVSLPDGWLAEAIVDI